MNEIAKYSSTNSLIQNLKYEVKRCKKEGEDEVEDMFKKLSSWMEYSQRQLSSTRDSHTLSINKGINELNETICDLETKLSVITKERDDLLCIVNNFSGQSTSTQILLEQESSDDQNLNGSDSDDVEYNIEEEQDEVTEQISGGNHQTEKEAVGRCELDAMCSSPYKSSQVKVVGHICQECNLAFSKSEYLGIHMKNFHSKGIEDEIKEAKEHICQECGYSTPKRSYLIRHRRWVHAKKEGYDNRKVYACEECSYTTAHKSDFNRHCDAVHNLGDKKFKCDVCPYTAAQKARVTYHMADIHKLGKTIQCDKCPYTSAKKSKLRRHIETVHEKIKNHVCKECGYAASQMNHLKQHMINKGH